MVGGARAQPPGFSTTGQAGTFGGGGAGSSTRNASATSGGAGGDGVVIITEYLAIIGDIDTGGINFYSGTAAPDPSIGSNGDVYLKY